jgi:hypothetical protein
MGGNIGASFANLKAEIRAVRRKSAPGDLLGGVSFEAAPDPLPLGCGWTIADANGEIR